MAKTFRVTLYTPQDISSQQTAKTLWGLLDSPLIGPHRYDTIERAKITFGRSAYREASRMYGGQRMLFVRGAKDSFLAMFMQQHGGWATWNFWWDAKAMTRRHDAWVEWLLNLCRKLPPFFGLGCSVAEYDAKHTLVETVPGGTATSEKGTSSANFYEYLPGLYWLSIFGPQLTDHFGIRLQSLPNTNLFTLNSAGVAVLLDEPAIPEDMNERLQTEADLAELLGSKYFFDRNKYEAEYEAVPELAEVLREMNS
jgi:hypothetical protein